MKILLKKILEKVTLVIFCLVVIFGNILLIYNFNNKFQNILVILLYIYVFIVSQRYINSINDFTYEVDNMYYLINYIIISLALICISINNFILLSIKK